MIWLLFMLWDSTEFKASEVEWRIQREEKMKASDSWLNLVGLFWLKEGTNPFGSDPSLRIALPRYSTVNKAGEFFLENGKVRYRMARGQRATVNGELRNEGELAMGEVLEHNHLRMFLIERGGKTAIRARDLRAKKFVSFQSLDFYSPKPKYLVEATYEPYDQPQVLKVSTVISTEIELLVPGVIHFELGGKKLDLIPTLETPDDEKLFIMFQDQTSGTTTYSGGRFLYADLPVDGKVTLNFNRAINPPCGYTVYATCPLPPAENWLEVSIEAGERVYLKGDDL